MIQKIALQLIALPYATVRSKWITMGKILSEGMEDLGDLQREVLQLVMAHAPITAEDVRERLSRPLKESTVRTVLNRLEKKGYLAHTLDGRTYIYGPSEPRGRLAARAVRRIIDRLCNGSIEEVLVGMVDTDMIDQKELRLLADCLKRRHTGSRK